MQKRILLLIEPWVCHFEVLPSVVYSSKNLFEDYLIVTPDLESARNALGLLEKFCVIEYFTSVTEAISRVSGYSTLSVWLNTTHCHSNRESWHAQMGLLVQLSKLYNLRSITAVAHNEHDYKWILAFQNLLNDSNQCNFYAVFLSRDMLAAYSSRGLKTRLFSPTVLSGYRSWIDGDSSEPKALQLAITGQNREGKGFNALGYFREVIKSDLVRFSYTGWSPEGSLRASGSLKSVNEGLLHDFASAAKRLPDDIAHQRIGKADALIDLKLLSHKGECVRASGNFGLSRSLVMPLVAHVHAYPSFPCITFIDYKDLFGRILNGTLRKQIVAAKADIQESRSGLECENESTLGVVFGDSSN